jgi:serine/threonine protein kinase
MTSTMKNAPSPAAEVPSKTISEDGPTAAVRFDDEDSGALVGQTLGDRYRLLEVLGKGGMGTVYRAQHVIIERPAAVKVLSRQFCSVKEIRERFYREARIATRIRHPNVMDVIDLGQTNSKLLYLVMELLVGRTLATRLESGRIAVNSCSTSSSRSATGLVPRTRLASSTATSRRPISSSWTRSSRRAARPCSASCSTLASPS